jgi:hypothetical protein
MAARRSRRCESWGGSIGFTDRRGAAAAELVKRKLSAAGLGDASVERLPADGKTRYAHFLSYYGWDPISASLEEVAPRPGMIARFLESPVALADYSQDADVTAELVDVGRGLDAKSYEGRDVKGKIVLADGAVADVHRAACEERGAAGFLSAYPNQTTAWSGEAFNLVDGKRSVSEIRDVLAGRYEPVPLAEVAEYLDRLARAGAVRFGP